MASHLLAAFLEIDPPTARDKALLLLTSDDLTAEAQLPAVCEDRDHLCRHREGTAGEPAAPCAKAIPVFSLVYRQVSHARFRNGPLLLASSC